MPSWLTYVLWFLFPDDPYKGMWLTWYAWWDTAIEFVLIVGASVFLLSPEAQRNLAPMVYYLTVVVYFLGLAIHIKEDRGGFMVGFSLSFTVHEAIRHLVNAIFLSLIAICVLHWFLWRGV